VGRIGGKPLTGQHGFSRGLSPFFRLVRRWISGRMTERSSIGVALAVGCVIGVATSTLLLGLGSASTLCFRGPALGSSGPTISPDAVAVPPPGGFVNWSVGQTEGHLGGYLGLGDSSSSFPVNASGLSFSVRNWTLYSVTAGGVPTLMRHGSCPAYELVASTVSWGGLAGSLPGRSASAGIGERSLVPVQLEGGWLPGDLRNYSSVFLNGSYGPAPVASFSWHSIGGGEVDVRAPVNLSAQFSYVGPVRVNGSFIGLGLRATLSEITFGVSILSRGSVVGIFAGGEPSGFPGVHLSIQITYILPATVDQGTWAVYAAGGGSGYPLGGYLFEQTS